MVIEEKENSGEAPNNKLYYINCWRIEEPCYSEGKFTPKRKKGKSTWEQGKASGEDSKHFLNSISPLQEREIKEGSAFGRSVFYSIATK